MKKNVVSKWFDVVANLTWGEVKKRFSKEITERFDFIGDDSRIDLTPFHDLRGDNIVISKFLNIPPAKRAKLARDARSAKERGEKAERGKFTIVNEGDKMQLKVSSRKRKYREMSKSIMDFILWA